jgi:hypothetical protein
MIIRIFADKYTINLYVGNACMPLYVPWALPSK